MSPNNFFALIPRYHVGQTTGEFLELASEFPKLDLAQLREFIDHGMAVDYVSTPYTSVRRRKPDGLHTLPFSRVESGDPPVLFRQLLKASLERQLSGCSQVVVAMSGGLDSTALAALCVEILGAKNVHAITVGYEWRVPDPEPAAARKVADHLGLEWTWIRADYDQLGWPKAVPSRVGPRVSGPQSEVEFDAMVGADVPVVGGYGGDPLMVGESGYYPRIYQEHGLGYALKRLATAMTMRPSAPGLGLRARIDGTFRRVEPGQELATAMFDPIWTGLFEDSYLAWKEGLGPQWVYPFFDAELYRYVAGLEMSPWRLNKHLIRTAFVNDLPASILRRPKSLATFPAHLMPPEAVEWMTHEISLASSVLAEIVDVPRVLAETRPGIYDWDSKLRLLRIAAVSQFINCAGGDGV